MAAHLQSRTYRQLRWLVVFFVVAMAFGMALATKAYACDPGQYYDPAHAICQGSAPAYPQPGYGPWQNNYPGIPSQYPGGGWGNR